MENNVIPLTVDNSFGRADFQPEYEESKKRTYTDNTSLKANGIDVPTFRTWANENGIAIPSRGRIPVTIVQQYLSEH
jgi:hypothetical protein